MQTGVPEAKVSIVSCSIHLQPEEIHFPVWPFACWTLNHVTVLPIQNVYSYFN